MRLAKDRDTDCKLCSLNLHLRMVSVDGRDHRCSSLHIALGTVLSCQALRVLELGEVTCRVDPVKVYVGSGQGCEGTRCKESGPHGVTFGCVSRWKKMHPDKSKRAYRYLCASEKGTAGDIRCLSCRGWDV